jgi:cysteine desulfurase/selenocysteine lyase
MGASVVSQPPRIYLDHAATSWPKPESVYTAMDRYSRDIGAAAGRGEYRSAREAGEIIASCRRRLMQLIGAAEAKQISLFSNGTAALNAAILGVVRQGDRVVTSMLEHNSVLRPLEALRQSGQIQLEIVGCNEYGRVDIDRMLELIDEDVALVALSHASNVTGAVQDIQAIGERVRDLPTLFLCDAAQTLGYLPIDVRAMGIDLLAAPGHKGACGPLGTGLLYVSHKATGKIRPTHFGGTGLDSESLAMPHQLPEMLEPGNLNVPAIAGWNAGLDFLQSQDHAIEARNRLALCEHLQSRYREFEFGLAMIGEVLPIASLVFEEVAPSVVGALLDSEFSIDVRCGLHCAALIHGPINTARKDRRPSSLAPYQGTLRISGGHGTTIEEIDAAADAVLEIMQAFH